MQYEAFFSVNSFFDIAMTLMAATSSFVNIVLCVILFSQNGRGP